MGKIQQISEITPTLPLYQESELLSFYRSGFQSSELGKIHALFPFSSVADSFGLKVSLRGRKGFFSRERKIVLMLLKSYTGLSDKKLIEQINGSIYFQLFCGIFIRPGEEIKDEKLPSDIRCDLAKSLDIDKFQRVLVSHWKPLLKETSVVFTDATCYESYLHYPTNEKILWESLQWVHAQIVYHCKYLKICRPRSKYDEIAKKYNNFYKTRKKSKKKKQKLRCSLLYLLNKLSGQLSGIERQYESILKLKSSHYKRRSVINQVLEQKNKCLKPKKVARTAL